MVFERRRGYLKRKRDCLKSVLKMTLLWVLPLVILFLILFTSYEQHITRQERQLLLSEQEKGSAIIANQLEMIFSQFVSDLLLVTDSAEYTRYNQEASEENIYELEELFIRIANKKEYINHIRLIDPTGMEIIKITHYPHTPAQLCDPSQLEDRSETEVFNVTHSHDANTLYISPIGLHSRQSFEDFHTNPAMILALPTYKEGEFQGLIIVDYDACFLLSFIRDYHTATVRDIKFGLVANDGTWIQQHELPCEDPLYTGEKREHLFSQNSSLGQLVLSNNSGSFSEKGTTYAFAKVSPKETQGLVWYPSQERLWTVFSYYDDTDLGLLSANSLLLHPQTKWLLALALFVVGILLLVFLQRRRADQVQLEIGSLISEYSVNGIVVLDRNDKVIFCNNAFEVLSGFSQEELVGKKPSMNMLTNIPLAKTRQTLDNEHENYSVWIQHKGGNYLLANRYFVNACAARSKQNYTVGVYTASTWKISEYLSFLKESSLGSMPQSQVDSTKDTYCLVIHLNDLTSGDENIFSQMKESSFSVELGEYIADELGVDNSVYIFSAETYAVVVRDDTSIEIESRIEALLEGVQQLCEKKLPFITCTAYCGYARFEQEGDTLEVVLRQASIALKTLEGGQGGQVQIFDALVHEQYVRKQAIIEAFNKDFIPPYLSLHYQAQLDVFTQKVVGAEALVRWNHPVLGPISPDEFIPLLEEMHLISSLGKFVICTAVSFLKEHQETLLAINPSFSLAINLSAEEFANTKIIDFIGNELLKQGVDPSLLSIELTERTAVESLSTTEQLMSKLRETGVSITIDDFGTGFSSLAYLLELSVEKIKIDRSFLASYPDAGAITIYRTVLLLAQELGISVVAEGVESEEQLQFLREVNCPLFQGFLFSKAVSEHDFLRQVQK